MERDELDAPPLPPDLTVTWHAVLDAWESGQRRGALNTAEAIVQAIADLEPTERMLFGQWVCELLFDSSDAWAGQFGGGLSPTTGGWERPVKWVLTLFPLTAGVVVPHVIAVCHQDPGGRPLRWLYQCLVGLSWRLTPKIRLALEETLSATCGPSAEPLAALERAAVGEGVAQQWLARFAAQEAQDRAAGRDRRAYRGELRQL